MTYKASSWTSSLYSLTLRTVRCRASFEQCDVRLRLDSVKRAGVFTKQFIDTRTQRKHSQSHSTRAGRQNCTLL